MHDAGSNFDALSAVVYADDTLLLATSDGHVQEFLLESPMLKSYTNTANTVSSFIGKSFSYFSSMHSYTEGEDIESTPDKLSRPGVTRRGLPGQELARRIGMPTADFTESLAGLFTPCSSEGLFSKLWLNSNYGLNY